jgi:hypothetical protein
MSAHASSNAAPMSLSCSGSKDGPLGTALTLSVVGLLRDVTALRTHNADDFIRSPPTPEAVLCTCYTAAMVKKITLEMIAAQLTRMDERMEKGFAAVADEIADVRRELKGDIASVQMQVNSIEQQLRETKTEVRLGDLEERVFGAARR